MKRALWLFAVVQLLFFPTDVRADAFDPPIKEVCPDSRHVDSEKLLTWIVYTFNKGLPLKAITGGTDRVPSREQLIAAVTKAGTCPTRDAAGHPYAKDKLPCGTDTGTQHQLVDTAGDYFALPEGHKDVQRYAVPAENPKFEFARQHPASPAEQAQPGYPLNEILAAGSPWQGTCQQEPPPSLGKRLEDGVRTLTHPILLRATPQDLVVPADGLAFKGLKSATFSLNNDRLKGKASYDIEGVLGYALDTDSALNAIPYIRYKRVFVEGKASPGDSDIDDLTVGFLGAYPLIGDVANLMLTANPEFVVSPKDGAKLVTMNLVQQPNLAAACLATPCTTTPLSAIGLAPNVYLQLAESVGNVLADGGKATLRTTNTFARVGPEVGMRIVGLEGALLQQFSLSTFYRYMQTVSGQFDKVSLYEVTASYAFPTLKNLSVNLSYDHGRDPTTFEREILCKLSIGLKF